MHPLVFKAVRVLVEGEEPKSESGEGPKMRAPQEQRYEPQRLCGADRRVAIAATLLETCYRGSASTIEAF